MDDAQIVTFYSYKGGTGRTMLLANVAWMLAASGKRVLALDWDLEAPGLHRYFGPFLDDPELGDSTGVLDWAIDVEASARIANAEPSALSPGFSSLMLDSAGLDVGWSPDGNRLAYAGDDGSVGVWDVATAGTTVVLEGHTGTVWSVGWSPDGNRLASGGADGLVRVWDVAIGETTAVLEGHVGAVLSVGWSPDGNRLASGGADGLVRVWDVAAGETTAVLEGHVGLVLSVGWSPDGNRLASAGADGLVRVWDVATGETTAVLEGHTDEVNSVGWSPDGNRLAYAGDDGSVRVWDVATAETSAVLEGHAGAVLSVGWSPDGNRLASAGADGSVRVWDVATGKTTAVLEGHTDWVGSVGWSPDGNRLASASDDESVRVWDVSTGETTGVLEGHTGLVFSVGWSPDGGRLASGGADGLVRVWDVSTGETTAVLEGHTDEVNSVGWSPDGNRLAYAGDDGSVRVWDVATGETTVVLEDHVGLVLSEGWSPDGNRLASAGADGLVRVWDVATGETTAVLEGHTDEVNSAGWSPDGNRLASASDDGSVRVWDVATGETTVVLEGHTGWAWSVGWSPDGNRLASAGADGLVRVWDVSTGETTAVLEGHTGKVWSVGWSPDGGRLASGGADGLVRVWDVSTGETTVVLEGHVGLVLSVGWSPDGNRLASAGNGGLVRVWDVALDDFGSGNGEDWWQRFTTFGSHTVPVDPGRNGGDGSYAFPGDGLLDFVPAGRQDHNYAARLQQFDWGRFYSELNGGQLIEELRSRFGEQYDVVLVDSRTGVSDTAGICTIHLPDDLVACYTLNRQSIDGCSRVVVSVEQQRREPETGRPTLKVWPVPTRVDHQEKERLDLAREAGRSAFGPFLRHLTREARQRYTADVEVMHQSYYSYEEILATIADAPDSTFTVRWVVEQLFTHLFPEYELPEPLDESKRRLLVDQFLREQKPSAAIAGSLAVLGGSRTLLDGLEEAGFDVWHPGRLRPGQLWEEVMRDSVVAADIALAVYDGASDKHRELFVKDRLFERTALTVPVGVASGEIAEELASIQPVLVDDEKLLVVEVAGLAKDLGLGRVADGVDPQKGVWGGEPMSNGRELSAIVKAVADGWYDITLSVGTTGGAPLAGDVVFYLPRDVGSQRSVSADQGRATATVSSSGTFTVGATCDDGTTHLELDLKFLDSSKAPKDFLER